jgi:hypothetical protein
MYFKTMLLTINPCKTEIPLTNSAAAKYQNTKFFAFPYGAEIHSQIPASTCDHMKKIESNETFNLSTDKLQQMHTDVPSAADAYTIASSMHLKQNNDNRVQTDL